MPTAPTGGTSAARAANNTGTPSAVGRVEIVNQTQGPPAKGGAVSKLGEAGLGYGKFKRDAQAKGRRVIEVVPKGDVYALLYLMPDQGASTEGKDFFATDKFLLTSVVMQQSERYQIVETFRRHLIYFMDEAPRVYQYSGVLYNAVHVSPGEGIGSDTNWRDRFLRNYEERLRGTKCVQNRVRVFIDYDELLVVGYMLNSMISQVSDNPNAVNFSFTLFVTSIRVRGGETVSTPAEEVVIGGRTAEEILAGAFSAEELGGPPPAEE